MIFNSPPYMELFNVLSPRAHNIQISCAWLNQNYENLFETTTTTTITTTTTLFSFSSFTEFLLARAHGSIL